jgi:hypothetical protein
MKRLGNIFSGILTATILLTCVAVVPAWIRSYFAADYMSIPLGGATRFQVGWMRGTCFAGTVEIPNGEAVFNSFPPFNVATLAGTDPQFHLLGDLGYLYDSERRILFIPFWLIGIVMGLLSTRLIYARIKRRSPKSGVCVVCGYDLRATPQQCPECGAAAGKSALNEHAR